VSTLRRFFGWWRVRPERWMTLLLVALTVTKGIFWVSLYPMWKIADEPAHFDNIQFRAEHHLRTPVYAGRTINKVMSDGVSHEMMASWKSGQSYFRSSYSSTSSSVPEEVSLDKMAAEPRNRMTNGQMTALDYPGVYYTLGVVPYSLLRERSIVYRVYAVRMISMLFGLMMVLATFFAGRLAFEAPELAFTAALLVALQPMISQQTAAVNNDAAVFGLCGLAFYLQVRMLVRSPERPRILDAALLGLTVALAILSKAQGWVMLVTSVIVLGWVTIQSRLRSWRAWLPAALTYSAAMYAASLWPIAPPENPTRAAAIAAAGVASKPVAMPYTAGSVFDQLWALIKWIDHIDTSYRFYLFQSAFGKFSWLEFSLSDQWTDVIYQVWPLISVGLVVAVVVRFAAPSRSTWWNPMAAALAAGTALASVGAIFFVEFISRVSHDDGVIQGRNFLFACPAFALLIVLALAAVVPKRLRGLTMAFTVTAAFSLNVGAVVCVLRRHFGG
jgi:hypothetical protein